MPEITDLEFKQYEALKRGRELRIEERPDTDNGGTYWMVSLYGLTVYEKTKEKAIARLKRAFGLMIEVQLKPPPLMKIVD